MLPESQLEKPRPSNLGRIIACPGSRRLVAMAPPKRSSTWADAGTAAHHVGEQCLTLGWAPFEYFGQQIEVNGQKYRVDADMVAAVSKYVHHVKTYERALGRGVLRFVERKLWLDEIGNGGTVDCLLVAPYDGATARVHVHDYKHGQGVYVSETWNAQFLAYGVAGARAILPQVPLDMIEFTFAVHQPRFADTAPCRTQTLPGREVQRWLRDTLVPALEAGRDPNAPLRAGPHCQFCGAKDICMEYLSAPRTRFGHIPIKAEPVPADFQF
jgi:hypothetical protein